MKNLSQTISDVLADTRHPDKVRVRLLVQALQGEALPAEVAQKNLVWAVQTDNDLVWDIFFGEAKFKWLPIHTQALKRAVDHGCERMIERFLACRPPFHRLNDFTLEDGLDCPLLLEQLLERGVGWGGREWERILGKKSEEVVKKLEYIENYYATHIVRQPLVKKSTKIDWDSVAKQLLRGEKTELARQVIDKKKLSKFKILQSLGPLTGNRIDLFQTWWTNFTHQEKIDLVFQHGKGPCGRMGTYHPSDLLKVYDMTGTVLHEEWKQFAPMLEKQLVVRHWEAHLVTSTVQEIKSHVLREELRRVVKTPEIVKIPRKM